MFVVRLFPISEVIPSLPYVSICSPSSFFEVFAVVVWKMWNERNHLVHEGSYHGAKRVIKDASLLLSEIQTMKRVFEGGSSAPSVSPWLPPPVGRSKLNVDAVAIPGVPSVAVGAVVRNHSGVVIAALSRRLEGGFSAAVAELLAIREGLQLAAFQGIIIEVVESDARTVVSLLNKPGFCHPRRSDY